MAQAVRTGTLVRPRFATTSEQVIHPVKLIRDASTWRVHDGRTDAVVPLADWGRLNISGQRFARAPQA